MNQYLGTRPIMESCPIEIPNARQCRVNHGLLPYENRGIEKVILKNRKVKFCNKCHRVIIKLVHTERDVGIRCRCDDAVLLAKGSEADGNLNASLSKGRRRCGLKRKLVKNINS